MEYSNPIHKCIWAKYSLGDVTQWFAENPELYQEYGSTIAHNGIDIVRPWGSHLYAVADSVVSRVKSEIDGYGKHVRLLSNHGDIYRDWVYGHMSFIAVEEGDVIKAGQYIGNIGNTGFVVSNATGNGFWDSNPYAGTHVHFGVRDLIEDSKGWSYPGVDKKLKALNYNNGYKGRYNPLPLFRNPELLSSKILGIASVKQHKTLLQFSQLLRSIDL